MTHRLFILLAASIPALACMGRLTGPGEPDPSGGTGGKSVGGAGGSEPVTAPPSTSAIPTCKGEEVPGPRRLRLLTRAEYARTVADLLGIALPAVANLPVESVVDGFDNNAAATAVTSRHLDEYLSTSERLAAAALAQSRGKLVT